jgi:gamma-glutamyl-gamma-aminobutyrate hydrolase PuuD
MSTSRVTNSSAKLKVCTEKDFITIVLPALKQAKALDPQPNPKLSMASFLKRLGFYPTFYHINFSAISDLVEDKTPKAFAKNKLYQGTDLLTHIDFRQCEFIHCTTDFCNFSYCYFERTKYIDCSTYLTIFQYSEVNHLEFIYCEMQRVCFDRAQIYFIKCQNSNLQQSVFTFLKACNNLVLKDCKIEGISFLGGVQPVNSSIAYSTEENLEDIYLFDKSFTLINATLGASKPAVGLSWNHQYKLTPYTASLARLSMLAQNLQPILFDYNPDNVDVTAMDQEIIHLAQEVRQQPSVEAASFPFTMLNTMLANSNHYPNISAIYRYAQTVLMNLDGLILPGGLDINPLFYNQEKLVGTKLHSDNRRDVTEFSMLHLQQELGLPTYGICRGSQIIAVSYGARFHQHIGERIFLCADASPSTPETPRSQLSQVHALRRATSEGDQDRGSFADLLYIHHQGFELQEADAHLVDILATTVVENDGQKLELTVAGESLPRNLFFIQAHPEGGNDLGLQTNLHINYQLANNFLESFYQRVTLFKQERQQDLPHEVVKRSSHNKFFLHLHKLQAITTPCHQPFDKRKFDTIVFGGNYLGMLAVLAAVNRRQNVAYIMVASINPVSVNLALESKNIAFISSTLSPAAFGHLLQSGSFSQSTFIISSLTIEKILLNEIVQSRKVDVFEIKNIGLDMLHEVPLDREGAGTPFTMPLLRALTALRSRINVNVEEQTLTLTNILSINGMSAITRSTIELSYQSLQIISDKDLCVERSMLELGQSAQEPIPLLDRTCLLSQRSTTEDPGIIVLFSLEWGNALYKLRLFHETQIDYANNLLKTTDQPARNALCQKVYAQFHAQCRMLLELSLEIVEQSKNLLSVFRLIETIKQLLGPTPLITPFWIDSPERIFVRDINYTHRILNNVLQTLDLALHLDIIEMAATFEAGMNKLIPVYPVLDNLIQYAKNHAFLSASKALELQTLCRECKGTAEHTFRGRNTFS